MKIERFTAPSDGPIVAARALERLLLAKDGHVLLLCSGGSALSMLDVLECPEDLALRLAISPIDERISKDPVERNGDRLRATRFVRTAEGSRPGRAGFLKAESQRYPSWLAAWRLAYPGSRILATLGIGVDGHIAGIAAMPDDPRGFDALFERDAAAVEYETARLQPPHRLTVTLPFLRQLDGAIVYATREKPVARALEAGPLSDCPARILREMREITLVTDSPDA